MSNIIDKIQLSGITYDIGGQGGSGVSVVEVSQAGYDALPSSAKTDTSKMYVITDAEAGDLTNYYTKTQTNTLLGGKADTATTYTKTEVDNAITAATATKQDTLVSGTNIKTINNTSILGSGNINIQGGDGKAIEAGTGIAITTGETADTINCTLPISVHSNTTKGDILFGTDLGSLSDYNRLSIGRKVSSNANPNFNGSIGIGTAPSSNSNEVYGSYCVGIGNGFKIGNGSLYVNYAHYCVAIGYGAKTRISDAVAIGKNAEASGTTKTNINNQLKIDTSNQIYIMDKDNTNEICLQDHLGGGGSSINVVQTTGSSTTDVMSQAAVTNIIGDIETLLSNI